MRSLVDRMRLKTVEGNEHQLGDTLSVCGRLHLDCFKGLPELKFYRFV